MRVTIGQNLLFFSGGNRRFVTFEEVECLTGSKNVTKLLEKRKDRRLDIFRTASGKLVIMDPEFIQGENYKTWDGERYKCLIWNTADKEGIMRKIGKKKKNLLLCKCTDGWMIDW